METIKIYNVFNNTSTATTIQIFSSKQFYFVIFFVLFFFKHQSFTKYFFE